MQGYWDVEWKIYWRKSEIFKSRVRKLEERIESLEKASATQTIKIEVSCMNIGEKFRIVRIMNGFFNYD